MNHKDIIELRKFFIENDWYNIYYYIIHQGIKINDIVEYIYYLIKENKEDKIKEIVEKLKKLYEAEKIFIKLNRLKGNSIDNKYINQIKKLNQEYDIYYNLLLIYLTNSKEQEFNETYQKFEKVLKRYKDLIDKIMQELLMKPKEKPYYL